MPRFTLEQVSNTCALIVAAHESGFTRRQLIAELQAELKCSGMQAGEFVNSLIESHPYCQAAFDSFHYTSPNYRW